MPGRRLGLQGAAAACRRDENQRTVLRAGEVHDDPFHCSATGCVELGDLVGQFVTSKLVFTVQKLQHGTTNTGVRSADCTTAAKASSGCKPTTRS